MWIPGSEERHRLHTNSVSPGFFDTFQIRLLMGRGFDDRDDASAPQAILLDEAAAREIFGDENPLGRTLAPAPAGAEPMEVVESCRA